MDPIKLKTVQVTKTRLLLLEKQCGNCALCHLPLLKNEAVLDHDHETGLVRASIHRSCNSGLGAIERVGRYGIKDILRFARGAAEYLELHQIDQTRIIHPSHFTKEEKIVRAKEKKIRAKKKKIRTQHNP